MAIEQAESRFAALLRRLRTSAGLTQEELAESAALSPRTISDLERGISLTARGQTARLLATALNLTGPSRSDFLAAACGSERDAATRASAPVSHQQESDSGRNRTLPRDISTFTGRADDITRTVRAVINASAGGVIGICAIGGMAGIGKTTLAVHAAHMLASQFPDGQIFVALHGHTPGQRPVAASDALASLLLAAGIEPRRIPVDQDARERCWRDYLAGRRVLLVLDDATGHDQIRPLLPGSGGSATLVTSRRRLTALEDAAVIDLDTLAEQDAAELLVRLCGRSGLKADDRGVAEITRLCGYLPLAVGMLARQLHHHPAWTPASIAAELAAERDRLGLLRAENISVDAAFSLSYRDLTTGQRRLFRRLGLQPGPDIDTHAAAAVGGLSLATTRRYLEAIYDQHLLTEPSRGRYRMHDLVKEHARALAAVDVDARDAALDRLLDYYLQTALAASHMIGTRILNYIGELPDGIPPACAPALTTVCEARYWMQAEEANLRAAAELAATTGRVQPATLIPAAMAQFLYVEGRWHDGIALHQTAVVAAHNAGDLAGQARAMKTLFHIQVMTADFVNARANIKLALTLDRQLGDRTGEVLCLAVLSVVNEKTGAYRDAMAYCQEALTISRQMNDEDCMARSLNQIGQVQSATGNYHAAAALQRRALDLYRASMDPIGQAETLVNLALADIMTGAYSRARRALEEAWAITSDLGDRCGQGGVLNLTGVVERFTGNYDAAIASHQAALLRFETLNLPRDEAIALNELGLTLQHTGDFAAASTAHQRALVVFRNVGSALNQAHGLNSLGELSLRLAATGDARQHHGEALALARDIGAQQEEARALEGIGRSHLHDGNATDGMSFLREALDIYQRLGTPDIQRVQEALQELAELDQ
ncbi:MAG: tetratricopeptide repeat protein [Streptosporangiaceae bacterium]